MKLANLVDPRLVMFKADVGSVDAAVQVACKAISALYKHEVAYDDVLAKVREREALGGTAFPTGIAIPHARLDNFEDFIIAPVIPKTPIPQDGESAPIRIVWVILISKIESGMYLNTLAKLVQSSKDAGFTDQLVKADSGLSFVQLLEKAGLEVSKNVTVADIMTKEVVSVKENATIRELVDIMFANHLRYVPVTDATGALVGEVGVIDVIKAGIPDYAFRLGSLRFLSELEPMKELLSHEDEIQVKDIMQKPSKALDPSSSVVEAAFEMAKLKKRHFSVVEQGKMVGVVSSMDILGKILRA